MPKSTATIKTSVTIHARPATVFGVISNFSTYKNWNPWINNAKGDCTVGAQVVAHHGCFGNVKHCLTEVIPPEKLRWELSGWQQHFVHATREVLVYPGIEGNTLVTLKVILTGLFLPVTLLLFRRSLKKQMAAEVKALKKFCEEQAEE